MHRRAAPLSRPPRRRPPAPPNGPQVRNAQLDKEAGELRSENEELHRAVEEGKHAAVRSEEVSRAGVSLEARHACLKRCSW
jgi:hypothetical protein